MGYLIVDDRASGGTLKEWDTVRCAHCPAGILIVKRAPASGAMCVHCSAPLCEGCAQQGQCRPYLQQIEAQLQQIHKQLQRDALMRAMRS